MGLIVTLRSIQHIRFLRVAIDFDRNGLMAIVGKNGCGKTTLARAIRNISFADTFIKTAAVGIFNRDSSIEYELDAEKIVFSYDNVIRSLNCRQTVPSAWKTAVSAELSIPFGERFNLESVEKTLYAEYQQPEFSPRLADDTRAWDPKSLFKELIRQRLISRSRIFEYLCDKNDNEMREFSRILAAFLTEPNIAAWHAAEE